MCTVLISLWISELALCSSYFVPYFSYDRNRLGREFACREFITVQLCHHLSSPPAKLGQDADQGLSSNFWPLCNKSTTTLFSDFSGFIGQKSIHNLFSDYRLVDEQLINDRNKIKKQSGTVQFVVVLPFSRLFMYTHRPLNRDLSRTTLFSTFSTFSLAGSYGTATFI